MSNVTEKLAADCRVLAADAQELVRATASQAGDKLAEVKDRLQASVAALQPRLEQARIAAKAKVGAATTSADGYVRAQPWRAVGIAAAVGLVIGLLIGRR